MRPAGDSARKASRRNTKRVRGKTIWRKPYRLLGLFNHIHEAVEKALAFLLLLVLLARIVGLGAGRRGCGGRLAEARIGSVGGRAVLRQLRGRGQLPACYVGRSRAAVSVQRAGADRLRAGDGHLPLRFWAERGGRHAGLWIDLDRDDAIGSLERLGIAVCTILQRAFHEFGPDGSRRMRTLEIQGAIIVEADPDHAQQFAREPGKPAVSRRAGLTRGGNGEAPRAHAGGGSRGPDVPHTW